MVEWKVVSIPILDDNFVHVLHNKNFALVVDPGTAKETQMFLEQNNLKLQTVLLTHHHSDHIGGVSALKKVFPESLIYAPIKEKEKMPKEVTHWLEIGDSFNFENLSFSILDVSGHTLGHIAYYVRAYNWLFSGDALFALGCGRIFEGTFEQTYKAMSLIKSLPAETKVFCTHDYFSTNSRFCRQEGMNIDEYKSVLPLSLGQELNFNPFLKAPNLEMFQQLREKRNKL